MIRATTVEELEPLLGFCRTGKLFEVQNWATRGKPIALPADSPKLTRQNPLRIAMDSGFHSLVQVLLEAGAPVTEQKYNALSHAVTLRRPDLAQLLIQHGAKVSEVCFGTVIQLWETEMVDLFLANGASLLHGKPVARGLVHKIRPALGLLKKYGSEYPELALQADFALRYHVDQGNPKWVGLLLWAGADPWATGFYRLDDMDNDPDENHAAWTAVGLAVYRGKLDLFGHKKKLLEPDVNHPERLHLIKEACHAPSSEVLSSLIALGHRPPLLADRGTGAISSLLSRMTWSFGPESYPMWDGTRSSQGVDTSDSRERLKMLHILVANGAKWVPADSRKIADARRNLLKMKLDYALEFAWLMREYGAARRRDVEELLRTESMVRHLAEHRDTARRLVEGLAEEILDVQAVGPCVITPNAGRSAWRHRG